MRRYIISWALLGLLAPSAIVAQGLRISESDIAIEQLATGEVLLRVRANADIKSILLTESTQDRSFQSAAYGLWTADYHPTNGDERRLLNNQFIRPHPGRYFLVDSSPYADELFGEAFHILIPPVVKYGYDWTRNGEIALQDGAFINIRTFALPYADYSGAFQDNPYVIRVSQQQHRAAPASPTLRNQHNFSPIAINIFANIAAETGGEALLSGDAELIAAIEQLLRKESGVGLDLVFVLDTTNSMRNDINMIRRDLSALLRRLSPDYPVLRVGMVFYRDYDDEYLTKVIGFERDLAAVEEYIAAVTVGGGQDNPEAVYEALHEALKRSAWTLPARRVILIGDAPPHPTPRAAITKETVATRARQLGVTIDTILLPK